MWFYQKRSGGVSIDLNCQYAVTFLADKRKNDHTFQVFGGKRRF